MGAIRVDPDIRRAVVDRDACVECYTCYRGMSTEHPDRWERQLARCQSTDGQLVGGRFEYGAVAHLLARRQRLASRA